MTTVQPSQIDLAKQGDTNAIAAVINQSLPEKITANLCARLLSV
jgi:hypothetical protein